MKYLSPSSLKMYERNPEKFYVTYLSKAKPPRPPQLKVMAIGSAVDARIKSFLGGFDLVEIFEEQVELQNREWAWDRSAWLFEGYKSSGALSELMLDLERSVMEPAYEFDAIGKIEGIPIFGKPDMFFVTEDGHRVIVDYKVNGYCSKNGVSPAPGYIKAREADGSYKRYPGAEYSYYGSYEVSDYGLPDDWAMQLTTYNWMLGGEVGDGFIAQIEQFACRPSGVRYVTHRTLVLEDYQEELIERYRTVWEARFWNDERLEKLAEQIKEDPRLWEML